MRGYRRLLVLAVAALGIAGTGCQGTVDHLKANFAAKQGNDFYKAQDFQKAVEWYRYSLYLNPELPIAYHNAGLAFMGLYKPGSKHPKDQYFSQQAIDNLTRYLSYQPDDEDGKNQLLTVYLQAERYDDAAKFFEAEMKERAGDPAVSARLAQTLGMIYAKKGDFESSLEWYKKRAEIDKDNPEATRCTTQGSPWSWTPASRWSTWGLTTCSGRRTCARTTSRRRPTSISCTGRRRRWRSSAATWTTSRSTTRKRTSS